MPDNCHSFRWNRTISAGATLVPTYKKVKSERVERGLIFPDSSQFTLDSGSQKPDQGREIAENPPLGLITLHQNRK